MQHNGKRRRGAGLRRFILLPLGLELGRFLGIFRLMGLLIGVDHVGVVLLLGVSVRGIGLFYVCPLFIVSFYVWVYYGRGCVSVFRVARGFPFFFFDY